ncbi:hypothetical protein [Anaeromyxobacter diazotrophicus]|uniref:DUF5666 domain-containing protein n=1 Tax=Anaeromyxobacter diazotrophicus TaxID=2590199 RepID=A0A7I9VN21_9BACT|nr:hypothetical protein [Anaeromyxobacter diazotrophicus]GEJ57795.1 hypothetical protein AMYX_25360 [Anaeromyxobacter diazotrophicus]
MGRAVALCGLFTLANPGRAAGAREPSAAGAAQGAGAEQEVKGPVQLLDPATRTLHLKNSRLTLHLDGDTQVTRDGRVATLAEVNEGDEVRASCSGAGDDVSVSRLELGSPGAAPPLAGGPSRGEDRSGARSEVDPKLSAPSGSVSGQSGRQTMPVQVKQR